MLPPEEGRRTKGFKEVPACLLSQPSDMPRGTISLPVMPLTSVEIWGLCPQGPFLSPRQQMTCALDNAILIPRLHTEPARPLPPGHLCLGHHVLGTGRSSPACPLLSGQWLVALFLLWPLLFSLGDLGLEVFVTPI